jgi:hypothetical protein
LDWEKGGTLKAGQQPCASAGQSKESEQLGKALAHKNKLLEYDRTSAQRSYVYDDQADYFESSTSIWLSEAEQEMAREKDEKRREKNSGRRKEVRISFDIAGGLELPHFKT